MSKVLVARELLEDIEMTWRVPHRDAGCFNELGRRKIEEGLSKVRALLAQPAEAEGPGDWGWLKLTAEVAEEDGPWEHLLGMTDCETAFSQSASPTRVLELIAALSAVTAERDALKHALDVKEEFYQDALHSHIVLAQQRDQLRAEVERYVPLHEAVQRAAGELPEGWAIQLYIERDGGGVELIGPDGTEDFATNNERLDYTVIDALEAAMAAKEA